MNIGDQIGQYRVTQLLGEGGMGAVYKAFDTGIERDVAIKVLRPEIGRNANLLQRFRAEAVTLARLNHSGIATLYSFQQYGDEFLMIMEYVPGKTLEAIEREKGALPESLAVPLFTKILEAIGPAHESGILHRDIKPANIMLTTWGAIKVMDFGIARIAGAARQTREGALVGTMEYIPPERVKGSEGDIHSDIYSLGVVFFEMLAGRLPFNSGSEFELMKMHLEANPPTLASLGITVNLAVEALLARAMAKDPAARFASCEDFADALRSATGDPKISRSDIVALVGKPAVEELGTAGHHSAVSGETQRFPPAPVAAPAPRQASFPGVDTARARIEPAQPSFFARYKVPILAVAALLLAIIGGIGFGHLFGDHSASNNEPPLPTPVVVSHDPSTPVAPANNNNSGGNLQPTPTPSTQTIQTTPVTELPADTPDKGKLDTPRASRPRRSGESLHDKSLKALDE